MNGRQAVPLAERPDDVLAEVEIGGKPFKILRGLGATTSQPGTFAALYELQRLWYELVRGEEPKKVRENREAYLAAAAEGRVREAAVTERDAPEKPAGAPTVSSLVRKSLLDGASTGEITKMVAAMRPDAKCDAKIVAFYRHQLKKEGKL